MIKKLTVSLLISLPALALQAENIDILSSFNLDELAPRAKIAQETGFTVRSPILLNTPTSFDDYVSKLYRADVNKIFFMSCSLSDAEAARLPTEKMILFLWEAGIATQAYCNLFSRVYTHNDDLVDGKQFFKFYYPVLMPMVADLPSFDQKKLCCMITQTLTPERAKRVEFFETKPMEDFDLWGTNPIVKTDRYRGRIPGHPLSPEKLELLKTYRFCICFENSYIPGYITEKIFTCFAAGSVPIYLGAPNVEKYIPKDCFIDYRAFSNDEELYQFITTMSPKTYQRYIDNIRAYLQSEKAHLFSAEHFNEILYEATINP